MRSEAILLSLLVALAEARFGQEQIPIAAIRNVQSGGDPGEASTLAGAAISTLLGGANPCDKLQMADEILAQLGTGADAIAAARGLVAAEKNFNPFAVSIPSICGDPELPANQLLRGIVPLVDPAVTGSDVENRNQAASLQRPFNAVGMSVAQVMAANGFSNFTTAQSAGSISQDPDDESNPPEAPPAAPPAASSTTAAEAPAEPAAATSCAATVTVTVQAVPTVQAPDGAAAPPARTSAAAPASETEAPAPAAGADEAPNSTIDGLDFGLCVPTMKFEPGVNGRRATEFTFQAIDPLVSEGQQEALNPNIITNRICDQLTNVCQANAAAKAACLDAKAQILALGTRNADTANEWNELLGFAGTDISPGSGN